MFRPAMSFGLALGAMLLTATDVGVPSTGRKANAGPADTCSMERLGRAAAADTSHLRRVRRESAPGKSAEGGETTIYYEGDRPRVVVISYYGETGRTVVAYYLAAPDQFLVQQEALEYAEPISTRGQPVITTRVPSTLYICGEAVIDPVGQDELAQLRSDLRAVLGGTGQEH